MILHEPFEISPRLLPGLRIPGFGWVSLAYSSNPGDKGRDRYCYYIDAPNLHHEGDDLQSGVGGGSLVEGFRSLLSFLTCEDPDLWSEPVRAWVEDHRNTLESYHELLSYDEDGNSIPAPTHLIEE